MHYARPFSRFRPADPGAATDRIVLGRSRLLQGLAERGKFVDVSVSARCRTPYDRACEPIRKQCLRRASSDPRPDGTRTPARAIIRLGFPDLSGHDSAILYTTL